MRWVKQVIKKFLQMHGYEIQRADLSAQRQFPLLKIAVEAHLLNHPPPAFLQIGANDGIRSDPLHELILAHHMPGLLVEPLPDIFATLCETYSGEAQLRFEQCAIGEKDGTVTMFRFRHDAAVPDWAHGMASFSRKHLAKFANLQEHQEAIEPVAVPCLTVRSLLAKHDFPDVDLLQIDTEGFDYTVIREALNAGLRPALINYENEHLSPTDHAACHALIASAGYDFVDYGKNTLAIASPQLIA